MFRLKIIEWLYYKSENIGVYSVYFRILHRELRSKMFDVLFCSTNEGKHASGVRNFKDLYNE